jgi:hypothetical protein
VADATNDIEQGRNQLLNTTAKLIGAHDDLDILKGLYRHRELQDTSMVEDVVRYRTLLQQLDIWKSWQRKWKQISRQLF